MDLFDSDENTRSLSHSNMRFPPPSSFLRYATLASHVSLSQAFFPFLLAAARSSSTTTTRRPMVTTSSHVDAFVPTVPAENVRAIQDLQPAALWHHFSVISSIPRPSKHEHALLQYIQSIATRHGLTFRQDAIGNLAVFVPGVGVGRDAAPVIVQGHLDMVTEKNQKTVHDFFTDPILLEKNKKQSSSSNDKEETWLTANGTTLGADNGIGVAAALALLEEAVITADNASSLDMPPLQLLFTIDEETGLTGAQQLDANALGLTGKTLLNLDTEEWGELYVGCAGGGESILTLDLQRQEAWHDTNDDDDSRTLVGLRVEGLLGGHSGINIHEGRANAILLCAAAIQSVLATESKAMLVSLTGGDKHNAIPREATAILSVPADARAKMEAIVQQSLVAAQSEYGLLETNLVVSVNDHDDAEETCPAPLEADSARRLVALLLSLPHGPLKYSHAMKDLVETSNNVASISFTDNDQAKVLCSSRSSVSAALEATRDRIAAVSTLAGATMERIEAYPGWNPNMKSPLLGIAQTILNETLGQAPGVKAIHAGLECGLLIEKLGGNVDALSFGPTITGAHSPDESINADTVPPFYQLVKDILGVLAKEKTVTT